MNIISKIKELFVSKQPSSYFVQVEKWLKSLTKQNIPDGIVALNFGVYETQKGYTLYMIGAKDYDKNNSDWACNEDFSPENKYCVIDFVDNKPNWKEFLTSIKTVIEIYISNTASFNSVRYITIGYDDGDLEIIKDPDIELIYVRLRNEGSVAFRPVQAKKLSANTYQIVSPEVSPEDEEWEFAIGDIVECELETLASGKKVLLATRKV